MSFLKMQIINVKLSQRSRGAKDTLGLGKCLINN